jgi:hypothetical protein
MQEPAHWQTPAEIGAVTAVRFLLGAGIWLLTLRLAVNLLVAGTLLHALLALFLITLPLLLAGAYEATTSKLLQRERYQQEGLFFRLFSGRLLLFLLTLLLTLLAACLLLVRLYLLPAFQWWLLAATVPLYLGCYRWLHKHLQPQYKVWLLTTATLNWARWLCPTLFTLLSLPLLWWQPGQSLAVPLGEAIETELLAVAPFQSSVLLGTLAQLLAIPEAIKQFLLGAVAAERSGVLLTVVLLDHWLTSYLLCALLPVFLLPRSEWRRLFGPLTAEAVPAPLGRLRLAVAAAVCSFVLVFVCVPALAWLEWWARSQPALVQAPVLVRLRVEQIGAAYYVPGTLDALQRAQRAALSRLDLLALALRQQSEEAFAAMENNVDLYLDWYYSLGGEYARIGSLLTGELEALLVRKLGETLQHGDPFAEVQVTLDAAVESSAAAQVMYGRLADSILTQGRVDPGRRPVEVVQSLDLGALQSLRAPATSVGFDERLLLSGGGAAAGLLTGAIAGKMTAKILGKSSLKLAAKGLGKLLASKAAGSTAGAGAGAATGAALGSVVPGFGTALGALVGGVIGGLALGLGVDYALLGLEEAIGREEFRSELLAAIDEAREEFLATLP